ncbi:MAG: dethiobiotin synthase, partial [Bacteroidota bacterium]
MKLFITGISTDVGKTIASAIITESLEADYWKPIQAGDLENCDSHKVKSFLS